ncbi:hypothetical protein NQZ68_035599 [Dissostichus eleginoides]|nr:hypothetical protein NQZ68_035599 [Dissostichus eleginoides]
MKTSFCNSESREVLKRSQIQQTYLLEFALMEVPLVVWVLSIWAKNTGSMHSHAVCDTEQDVCACLYSLPVISTLAAGDKAQWHSVRLRLALCKQTAGRSIHTSNTTVDPSARGDSGTLFHYPTILTPA